MHTFLCVNVIVYRLSHTGAYSALVTDLYNVTCTPSYICDTTTTAILLEAFLESIKPELDACTNYASNTITASNTAVSNTTAANDTSSTTGNIGTTAQVRLSHSTYCIVHTQGCTDRVAPCVVNVCVHEATEHYYLC
jgi:hypothetical protein